MLHPINWSIALPYYAAALAFILFAVILVLTLTQNRLSQRQVFHG